MDLPHSECTENLEEPENFPFPFAPYDIQLKFMQNLFNCLEHRKLGIFESPTGTGKSLSIICGALKWLKDHNEHKRKVLSKQIAALEKEKEKLALEDKDWFSAQSKELEVTRHLNSLKLEQNKILEYDKKIEKIKKDVLTSDKRILKFKRKGNEKNNSNETKDNLEVEAEDKGIEEDEDILLEELAPNIDEDGSDEEEESEKYKPTKIFIASRTHSQLSQFVGEIIKSPFNEKVRVITLASRQNYCINPSVKKLNNMALMNEKCLDMQKKSKNVKKLDSDGKVVKKQKDTNCQCPYYKPPQIEDLKNWALNQVHDIEDLVNAGKQLTACPYYASRKAAEDAELILVPYNTLLHKSTREANGIDLKDNVVIIDEAHNILEALAQMHGSDLSYGQLYYGLHQLKCYKQRYNTLFSASTMRLLNQLIFVVNKLFLLLDKDFKEETTNIFTLENFVLTAGIEQYNFFNLIKFCKGSKIAQKVRSYSMRYPLQEELNKKPPQKKGVKDFLASIENKKKLPEEKPKHNLTLPVPNNPILGVISFLGSLTYSYDDGRILLTKSPEKTNCKMQFLLLNSSTNFSDVVKEARSVIVAGGTMKPNSEFRDRLFIGAGASPDNIVEFSCDHIIPPENILPIAVTKGQKHEKLLFNFTNRMSMGNSIKDILKQACQTVKGGIVVFFPSYNYEHFIWEQVKNINFERTVFREPQNSAGMEEVLEKYASTIKKSKNGALLFSVVGGKLSEGLNFSDDLGRCVIVVGLPYANVMAADLNEKMAYLDNKEGHGAGQKFYENLCMKSVNQCIGRAVRHQNDYATVLLLDERYGRTSTKTALPDWIKRSLRVCQFSDAFEQITKFFQEKQKV